MAGAAWRHSVMGERVGRDEKREAVVVIDMCLELLRSLCK